MSRKDTKSSFKDDFVIDTGYFWRRKKNKIIVQSVAHYLGKEEN